MQQKAIRQKIKVVMYFISACDIRLKQYLKGIQLQTDNNVFPKKSALVWEIFFQMSESRY